jgi:acetyl esterase/lipase
MYVHGGAWIGGDKSDYSSLGGEFASRGIAVAVINYRLAPATRHPGPVRDLEAAFAWLSAHAKDYSFDPNRIFVMGHSAGAHMAASLAAGKGPFPAGYIGLEGIYDIPALVARWPRYRGWFIEWAFGGAEKGWADASPARRTIAGKGSWLVVHSETDELVDSDQSAAFAKHLADAGVSVERLSPRNRTHFGILSGLGTDANPVTQPVLDFVNPRSRPSSR